MSAAPWEGKTAVITGASRGLGAGLVGEFQTAGLRVAGCARTLPKNCDFAAAADVSDAAALDAFVAEAARELGSLDLMVHNAGVLEPVCAVRDLEADAFRRHLDINLVGALNASRSYMTHAGGGVLIHISSGAAWSGYAGWAAYCAGKAGLDRLAETIQLEEADSGLRVHAVAPGVVDTDMQTTIRASDAKVFPMLDKFLEMKEQDSFNTIPFVANHLLRIAFDPAARPTEVVLRLPAEKD